jgi:myo-inositol-1(or 4)-monophosphatase
MYNKELKIVKKSVKEAGLWLEKEFNKWTRGQAKYKAADEIVTWCDKKSESIILKYLNKHFPKYALLSEESGLNNKTSDYFWTVDPLDGTSNFTIHNPLFTVSVSLFYKNKIVLGVTYMPILNEMYWAVKGQGAYRNGKKINVSDIKNLSKAFTTYCHGQSLANHRQAYKIYEHFHEAARDCRHFGSTTLEIAMVAAGHTDALMIAKPKIWDVAAGVILTREAGGKVTDFAGKQWNKQSTSLIATNTKIHSVISQNLRKIKIVR